MNDLPLEARIVIREIGHVHEDLSSHFYFSPLNAKLIIEKGWDERHHMTTAIGGYIGVGRTFLMIFGPRDEDELEITTRMVAASISYMTGEEVGVPWSGLHKIGP